MPNQYLSDKPIDEKIQDKFGRYPFSKRIAETIISSKNNDCIVIGIYGAWGEGKTSVLNFIENEFVVQEEFVITKFNPWRFQDEVTLISQFFTQISESINKKSTRLAKIGEKLANRDNIGTLLADYGDNLSYLPYGDIAKKGAEGVGKFLKTDLEEKKKKIAKKLFESKYKIVIFIDDIDRLDKEEIYSLFRLVKLSADFPKTVYILAFDEEMVSAAIGTRFGSGDKSSGRGFLEKIIQVPLKLPEARPNALKEYFLELLQEKLKELNVAFSGDDQDRFSNSFIRFILPKLKTPRHAIRYINGISFIIPLIGEEINIVDLLLIEGIKNLYPKHYEFIKSNKYLEINSAQQHQKHSSPSLLN